MSLDFEYGIQTGNRFGGFIDHDEDPEEFIAQQSHAEDKTKKPSKDTKTPATAKKSSTGKPTTTAAPTATSATGANAKSNKENVTGKSNTNEQRRQQTVAFSENQQQQSRPESGRGTFRGGYPRRGGSAGYEGAGRGAGRGGGSQRFTRFEGQQGGNAFEQGADAWTNQGENEQQGFGGPRGRGRGGRGGRGGPPSGRGRGEGGRGRGRGYNNNRNFGEYSQGQEQEGSGWEQSTASAFDTRAQGSAAPDAEIPISPQGQSFEADPSTGRGTGRGQYRSRTFRSNRNQGERSYHQDREGEQHGGQDEQRQNRRAHDRQPRNFVTSVKSIEKKDGQGAHNWGDQTALPDEEPVVDESAEASATPAAGAAPKDWSQQVDEEERQMLTLDEYKRQLEEKKKLTHEKLPQFNRRTAGEGEDPKVWKEPAQVYRKKNDDGETEEEEEGESDAEEGESADENEEQASGKKKIINIPLQFKPIDVPRGPSGGRGGRGRGGYSDRPRNRDDQGARAPSPTQQQQQQQHQHQHQHQQTAPASQTPGDEERPQSGYRGGRGGSRGAGRGEYRRSYGNAARGSRGGSYSSARAGEAANTLDLGNAKEFPTLPKQ